MCLRSSAPLNDVTLRCIIYLVKSENRTSVPVYQKDFHLRSNEQWPHSPSLPHWCSATFRSKPRSLAIASASPSLNLAPLQLLTYTPLPHQSTGAGCTGDENPTGTLAYWYDFRKHRIRTLCIFRTACSDVFALECSSKRRNITMYYIFSQKRKSYQCASIPEGFSSPLQRAVASLTLAPPLVFCHLQI